MGKVIIFIISQTCNQKLKEKISKLLGIWIDIFSCITSIEVKNKRTKNDRMNNKMNNKMMKSIYHFPTTCKIISEFDLRLKLCFIIHIIHIFLKAVLISIVLHCVESNYLFSWHLLWSFKRKYHKTSGIQSISKQLYFGSHIY